MPVESHDLHSTIIRGRVLSPERLDRREDQRQYPDRDVRPVEPRHGVEGRPVQRAALGSVPGNARHEPLVREMDVLVYLNADERGSQNDRRDQPLLQTRLIAMLDGGKRLDHRN